jgi:hypothetical protein
MSIEIELSAEEEARLRAAAERNGVSAAECARQLLVTQLPAAEPAAPPKDRTLELFAQWEAEDATDDPEEIRRAEEELAELKKGLDAPRAEAGARLLFP